MFNATTLISFTTRRQIKNLMTFASLCKLAQYCYFEHAITQSKLVQCYYFEHICYPKQT